MSTIGIDASNIKRGGGLTHLRELLAAAVPAHHGITHVIVWSCNATLQSLPNKPWLIKQSSEILEGSIFHRLIWQRFHLQRICKKIVDLLFVPGGNSLCNFHPFVAMSQNILPFDSVEQKRFSWSYTRLRYKLLAFSQAKTFQNAEGTIFLTEYAKQIVSKKAKHNKKAKVIPHGISQSFQFKPRIQEPIDSYNSQRPFKWLYVSIINFYKHQWSVAKAINYLRQRDFHASLDLIGPAYSPALKRYFNEISQLPDSNLYIKYHGEMEHKYLSAYYHQADAFIFASSCENLPIILLEAMAAGLPIACSNRGPMPEILKDAGVYFDPESPEQIANAMKTIMLSPDKRAEYADRAFKYAGEYTWSRCARQTFSFLAEVARKHN
jgi:glycosyltransferase involved in cell wall biosynthesis